LNRREWAAVIPLVAMMVWMGVYTRSFLPPIGAANAAVLRQSEVNVQFLVEREGWPVNVEARDAR
jgi:NADH-quinone oxidoreductase subunit M